MLVPFLVLNIFMNENGNLLVMVTNVLIVALYIFCSQNLVDEQVMNYGILKYILPGQQFAVRMWDLYMFHDEKCLCSAMRVVLLVYVVFGHPKYHIRKRNRDRKRTGMADPCGISGQRICSGSRLRSARLACSRGKLFS